MKNLKKISLAILILALLAGFTACGGSDSANNSSNATSAGVNTEAGTKSDDGTNADTATKANDAAKAEDSKNTSGAKDDSQEVAPAPEAVSKDNDVLGEWVDISDSTRFAHITKTDSGYQYEDNDGKYAAVFSEGILGVKVAENDVADVYLDKASGNLILDYHGEVTKFKKK